MTSSRVMTPRSCRVARRTYSTSDSASSSSQPVEINSSVTSPCTAGGDLLINPVSRFFFGSQIIDHCVKGSNANVRRLAGRSRLLIGRSWQWELSHEWPGNWGALAMDSFGPTYGRRCIFVSKV